MMELQLGLGLPAAMIPRSGFDLNCCLEFDEKKLKKRRRFENNDVEVIQTLPLVVWAESNNNPPHQQNQDDTNTNNREVGDEQGMVGWPPINSVRRKLYHQQRHRSCEVVNGCHRRRLNNNNSYLFVKVKMEGVGIARKIDLTAHHSYQTLTNTLIALFGRSEEEVEAYKLTYQDKEGDWLLAGDLPWGTFILSVQRLKLVKKGKY